MARALLRDSGFQGLTAALAVISIPYLVPVFEPAVMTRYSAAVDLGSAALLVGLLLFKVNQLESEVERAFWRLTAVAYGCWLLSEAVTWLVPNNHRSLTWHLSIDAAYLLLFLLSLVAAEMKPDGRRRVGAGSISRWLESLGLAVTFLTFILYFLVLPSHLDPQDFSSGAASLTLYAVFDLAVALRYGQLAWRTDSRRWCILYGLIAASMSCWSMLHSLTALERSGWIETESLGDAVNLLWHLPVLTLGAAARLRHHDLPEGRGPKRQRSMEWFGGLFRVGSPLVWCAFLLPLTHGFLSATGIAKPAYQTPREWLVVGSLLALGILLWIEHRLVRSAGRETQRRHIEASERAIEASEERFRILAAATFEGVLVHDGKIILDANEQLARMFGTTLEQVIGAPVGARVAAAYKKAVRDRFDDHSFQEPLEFEAYRMNREPFVVEVRARELPSLGPDIRVAVLRDVTHERQLEATLRQAQKMEAVGRFAGGIAHDFNNLLTVILGTCDLMKPESAADDIQQIRQTAKRAAAMTRQILAFSRRQHLALQTLDLNDVVHEVEPLLRRLLPENIAVTLRLAEGLAPVRADPGQLGQVVLNLAINARDAMPAGGELTIETAQVEAVRGGRPQVQLTVADNGLGIVPEVLPKIFDPFFTTKERGEGTGLGLATVHGIVHQCDGLIEAESQPGQGTTFRVLFPISAEEESASHPRPSGPSGQQRGDGAREWRRLTHGGTVLVVEDQRQLGRIVSMFLRKMGLRAEIAEDGDQAIALATDLDGALDLLIADVMLPTTSGPELAAELEKRIPGLPTLFMSGYSEGPYIEAIQGRPLLHKPFNLKTFAANVYDVLGIDPADRGQV